MKEGRVVAVGVKLQLDLYERVYSAFRRFHRSVFRSESDQSTRHYNHAQQTCRGSDGTERKSSTSPDRACAAQRQGMPEWTFASKLPRIGFANSQVKKIIVPWFWLVRNDVQNAKIFLLFFFYLIGICRLIQAGKYCWCLEVWHLAILAIFPSLFK